MPYPYPDPSDPLLLKAQSVIGTDRQAAQTITTMLPPPLPTVPAEVANFTTGSVPARYRTSRWMVGK